MIPVQHKDTEAQRFRAFILFAPPSRGYCKECLCVSVVKKKISSCVRILFTSGLPRRSAPRSYDMKQKQDNALK